MKDLHIDLERFQEEGYLVVQGLLDPEEDLRPIREEYAALLDRLARRWYEEGRLSSAYEDLPFEPRLIKVSSETRGEYYSYIDISFTQTDVSDQMPMHHGPAVFHLLRNARLLDAVEQFIGPEIYSNPVQHVRIKPPESTLPKEMHGDSHVGVTAWHQDQGVVTEEADQSDILTVWLPVLDAPEEKGCLAVVPGSHKRGLISHCTPTAQLKHVYLRDELLGPDRVPVPMKAGDALFMDKMTMHGSLPNLSDGIRWSLDLRYNPIGQATGRPWFPGFVARSRAHPEQALDDPEEWGRLWDEAGAELMKGPTPIYNRWKTGDPLCA